MLPVLAYGELLIDFIGLPAEAGLPPRFAQYAGGAPGNAAVAVAKLGGQASFVGRVGRDDFGDFLVAALEREGVDASRVSRSDTARTPLAFVALDAHGERSFTFYRQHTADLEFTAAGFDSVDFSGAGLLHVCSNTLTDDGVAAATIAGARRARASGWLVSFDVNLRHNLWPIGREATPHVLALFEHSDLVKLSREELDVLRGDVPEATWLAGVLERGARLVVVTDGPEPLRYFTPTRQGRLVPPAVRAVDTTAAGDAFCGGLLYGLASSDVTDATLPALLEDTPRLETLLHFALACGAFAVTRPGAFASLPRREDVSAPLPA